MNEQRFVVADLVWQRLEPPLPGKASDAGTTAKERAIGSSTVAIGCSWKPFSDGFAMARLAARFRQLEQPVPAFPSGGQSPRIRQSFQRYAR